MDEDNIGTVLIQGHSELLCATGKMKETAFLRRKKGVRREASGKSSNMWHLKVPFRK